MKQSLFLLASFFMSAHSFATNNDSSKSDLIHYFQSSSLAPVQDQLNSCQTMRYVLDKKIYHTGFWDEINTIRQLGSGKLTHELTIEIVGDNLQLLGSQHQPLDLYNKSKKILLSKGLVLSYETIFNDLSNTKRHLSIFKKPQYFIKDIQMNISQLTSEQEIVSKNIETCINKVLNDTVIENLTSANNQKQKKVMNDFYQSYPQFKIDKVLEKIFQYQTDRYIYLNPIIQQKIMTEMNNNPHYDVESKKILTHIFNAAMKKSYVKENGVHREIIGLYEDLFFWTRQSKQDIQNMIYYQYDSVNFNHLSN